MSFWMTLAASCMLAVILIGVLFQPDQSWRIRLLGAAAGPISISFAFVVRNYLNLRSMPAGEREAELARSSRADILAARKRFRMLLGVAIAILLVKIAVTTWGPS
jgi:Na+/melibiose symporter-like transporter